MPDAEEKGFWSKFCSRTTFHTLRDLESSSGVFRWVWLFLITFGLIVFEFVFDQAVQKIENIFAAGGQFV